jgi:hypothetical protein
VGTTVNVYVPEGVPCAGGGGLVGGVVPPLPPPHPVSSAVPETQMSNIHRHSAARIQPMRMPGRGERTQGP